MREGLKTFLATFFITLIGMLFVLGAVTVHYTIQDAGLTVQSTKAENQDTGAMRNDPGLLSGSKPYTQALQTAEKYRQKYIVLVSPALQFAERVVQTVRGLLDGMIQSIQ